MSYSELNKFTPDLHAPLSNMVIPILSKIIQGEKIGVIPPNTGGNIYSVTPIIINDCTIYVDNSNEDYVAGITHILNTPLSGKYCYVHVSGGNSWLPSRVDLWKIQQEELINRSTVNYDLTGEDLISGDRGLYFAKVNFVDEVNVAELVCNAHAYYFDNDSREYQRHTDPQWNATKATLRRFLPTLSGGTDDRVADYGRLILFLLSKVTLTEEEKTMFGPLLASLPDANAVSSVVKREARIQKFVSEAKKDPIAFINWKENWGKFWWENAE